MYDDFKRPLGDTTRTPVERQSIDETEPPVRQVPPTPEKKTRSKAGPVLGSLLVLALLGAGVLGYFWWQEQQALATERDRAETLQARVVELQALNQEAETEAPVVKDDKALIIETVVAYVKAPVSAAEKEVTVEVLKNDAKFAYAVAGYENSEGVPHILKSVEGVWTVVYAGQEPVPAADIAMYSIPEEYQTAD